jgi:hypothetical protein
LDAGDCTVMIPEIPSPTPVDGATSSVRMSGDPT